MSRRQRQMCIRDREVMEELLEENGYDIDDFENLLEEDEDDE